MTDAKTGAAQPAAAPKKRDKAAVTDEVWSDERVRSFLQKDTSRLPGDADFQLLLHAYQSMRDFDFERFIGFFIADGHQLDAVNEQGQTFVDYVARHRKAGPFIEIMVNAGARPPQRTESSQ